MNKKTPFAMSYKAGASMVLCNFKDYFLYTFVVVIKVTVVLIWLHYLCDMFALL